MANQYSDNICEEKPDIHNHHSPSINVKTEQCSFDEDEEPVGCTLCGRVFGSEVELQQHAREEHVTEYMCGMDFCMRSISRVIKNQFESNKFEMELKIEKHSDLEDFDEDDDYTEYFALPDVNVEILNQIDESDEMETPIKMEKMEVGDEPEYLDVPEVQLEHLYPEQKLGSDDDVSLMDDNAKQELGNLEEVDQNDFLTNLGISVNGLGINSLKSLLTKYTCYICRYETNEESIFKSHLLTHAPPVNKRKPNVSRGRRRYVEDDANAANKPYSCKVCKRRFAQISHLNTHKVTHTGEKPYSCDICDRKFAQSSHLNTHKVTHTGEKPYTCEICNRKFAQSSHLNTHKVTHTGERPYSCDICDRKFAQSSHLNTHKLTHTGERPYSCDICDQKFFQNSHLNAHKIIHTGYKPYSCDLCNRRFFKINQLNVHVRIHLEGKLYTCNVCKHKFSTSSDLDRHVRTHTGEKPFGCELCKRKFSRKSDLNEHVRTHTGEKPYHCEICNVKFSHRSTLFVHKKKHKTDEIVANDVHETEEIVEHNGPKAEEVENNGPKTEEIVENNGPKTRKTTRNIRNKSNTKLEKKSQKS